MIVLPSRTPAGSGTFYPSLPGRLRADVRAFLERAPTPPRRVHGVLVPHASYTYSGATAGAAFGAVEVPATCVVLAPNHTGRGIAREGGSLLIDTSYRTPLGDVEPDAALGAALRERAHPLLVEDPVAHAEEHGVEVLLPFLQMRNPTVRVVPLVIGWNDWERTRRLAHAIHDVIVERSDVLIVASSDMSHYEAASTSTDKDTAALERVVAVDPEGLLEVTQSRHIAMCGRAAVACALEVARRAGHTRAEVVAYSHSGVVNGNNDRVVSYAAALIGS
ncbi:MAG: AmmeMemoRadiSam system protein B [Gemmatimonadaceae bacterium]